jgi:hypothetical protein
VALLDPAASLGPVLEVDELGAAIATDDLGCDRRVLDDGPADRRGLAIGDQQDPLDLDRIAGGAVEELDLELRADLDAVLLTARLDDCVHGTSGPGWRSRGVGPRPVDRKEHLDPVEARAVSVRPSPDLTQRPTGSGRAVRPST